MPVPNYAQSFRDLRVYQKTVAVEVSVLVISRSFPREEVYSLTDQIRRSSRSVGAQIAEAWARRNYPSHFASKLSDADAEQMETQHWLDCSVRAGYVAQADAAPVLAELEDIGRMLNGMIVKADLFCKPDPRTLREETATYFVTPRDRCPARNTDHGTRDTE